MGESGLVNLANTTLMRRDAALGAFRYGARLDTVASMQSAPIQEDLLFPEAYIGQAEAEIKDFKAAQVRDRRARAPQARSYQPKSNFTSPSHAQGAPGASNSEGNAGNKSFQETGPQKKVPTPPEKGTKFHK